jgi:phosphopantothenoylcysteine decarboxylase/phosphopantothenate--cysteine ligase
MKLKGTKILLGVCGSIAAYKSALLTRLLVKEGADVRVVMTKSSQSFVGPLTFSTLSKNEVLSTYFHQDSGKWNNHVELGIWPDLMLIAPATANSISAFSNGLCTDLLQAIYLSARCPVMMAPAMDLDMYQHPSFQRNLEVLKHDGVHIIPAEAGELASGLNGQGRMAEPELILEKVLKFFSNEQRLSEHTILVNAGPTYEAIDPVRFIGNKSTGKMGVAIANELGSRGASVKLVLGPSILTDFHKNVEVIRVESASEMEEACINAFKVCDAAILSAAVADFTPLNPAKQKIKKNQASLSIDLKTTTDILATLGKIKENRILIGFAMETENVIENARKKLHNKNLDLIVVNSLNEIGAGFGHDTNKVHLLFAKGAEKTIELKLKTAIAKDLANELELLLAE